MNPTRQADFRKTSRPLLKWAGGKSQLLEALTSRLPLRYGRYLEPFFGGGALFFALAPEEAIISDSNPEIINLYRSVAKDLGKVIDHLSRYRNEADLFYSVRAMDWTGLDPAEAAARTLFLNRTCFNGLYRVNRKGQFNVPFGRYASPRILDEETLRQASLLLKKTTILCGDYKEILAGHARPGDFVFLDPPYLPISTCSDFKRYTKEQFHEEDHRELASEVHRLNELGCHVVLTNSNHPLVHELYQKFRIETVQTRRSISSKGKGRTGEDTIVTAISPSPIDVHRVANPLSGQVFLYPQTRFMGSKNKLLSKIWSVVSQFDCETFIDLFSGSGIVGYMMKAHGKKVYANDYMAMSAAFTRAMIENSSTTLPPEEASSLLVRNAPGDSFVERTFPGLYFSDEDNRLIDILRANIRSILDPDKQAIAVAALIRACLKKRPRGIFTYVGHRYDDGRRDLQCSFREQFLDAVEAVNGAVFDNGQENRSRWGDAMSFQPDDPQALVYIDPPYFSPYSDNEYVRRYHFVEGLARNWEGVEIQTHTVTKKFRSYPTPFASRKGASEAFDRLFRSFSKNVLVVSYSSNSLPSLEEMKKIMSSYKKHVEVVPVDYRYTFGNQGHKIGNNNNDVLEYLFVGY